jgi:hypothetical protein
MAHSMGTKTPGDGTRFAPAPEGMPSNNAPSMAPPPEAARRPPPEAVHVSPTANPEDRDHLRRPHRRCGRCFGVSSGLSVVARALGADLEHPAFGARQAPRLVGLDAQSKEVHVEESVSLPSQTATGEFTPLAAVASIPEPPPEPKPRWPGPGAPPPLVANRYQPWAPPRREPEELPRSEPRRRPSKRGWR